MKTSLLTAAAILIAVPLAARAEPLGNVQAGADSFAPPSAGGVPLEQRGDAGLYQRRGYDEDAPPPYGYRRWQARQGLILSLGAGGGAMYLSTEQARRVGALDLNARLGYGFSDRFQMFMEINSDLAHFSNTGDDVASWTFTLRGQTVLIGDRQGNGLNLNFGAGIGGVTYNGGTFDQVQTANGFALAGGISYSARISRQVALEPEFFVNWHAIPNDFDRNQDVASTYGLRMNLVWYIH
jgi:opacity protein-like surface antigen